MTIDLSDRMNEILETLNQMVINSRDDQESLMLAAGMLTVSKQIFEYYLGTEQANEMLMSQVGDSDEQVRYQIH
jgi:CYTH domain-containing protein